MKTKIVYVVTSNKDDYYLEQTLISVLSIRMHSPDAYIILTVDESTNDLLVEDRQRLKDSVDEIIVAAPPKEYNNMQKSRYIKTSLRNLIKGNFLFIDSDTIISAPLDEIDEIDASVAAVKDKHLIINKHQWNNLIVDWAKAMNWHLTSEDNIYFNSGVFLVKDDVIAHDLYQKWHENWLESNQKGLSIDQPALGKANSECGYVIQELSGEWNCQILENGLRFLSNAKIIHFFSSTLDNKGANSAYKLKDVHIYERLRNIDDIPTDIMSMIKYPKQAFKDKVVLLSDDEINLMSTPLYQKMKNLYLNSPKQFSQIDTVRRFVGRMTRILHLR